MARHSQFAYRPGRGLSRLVCFVAAAALLASCSLNKPAPPCPPILVLRDAANLVRFKPGRGRDIIDVDFDARIADFKAVCQFEKDMSKVEVKINLAFLVSRGPANRDHKASFQYFVAIPHFHPAPEGKKIFSKGGEFQGNLTRMGLTDELTLTIPLDRKTNREDYAIYLGFQLNPDEIDYNRKQRRFP